ncbi:NAD-dependent epimerase/dehydratase family protein [Lewinella sp. IMCC34183]|uniref:NAD-dependent epimerase/dehydratase family protein n=1 Tax=Lewinella sp. IMCC34183 TaxID=2248762 RepID=UPI000E255DE7|nr:NAD-dependent epimerase/dehydratase family protein [Lewinella sp. IMCC34183]
MERPTLVIAGATGFLGRWFIERYHHAYRIIALSRSAMQPEPGYDKAEWRQVELYSVTSTEEGIAGADLALYLVHSMSPSARLSQGNFEDTDLLLADNFARACRNQGLRQILFVGGILPEEESVDGLSRHLRSRREVELTLASTEVPVTTLRAGIIVGPGGSSFRMIDKLVRRLPMLICPAWCQSETHPIGLDDTLAIIDYCLDRPDTYDRAIDIGGSEVTTYMDMLSTVAELRGKRRVIRPVRFFTAGLSTLWVSKITNTSQDLVKPLVESLRHRMVARDNDVLRAFPERESFRESAGRALEAGDRLPPLPPRQPAPPAEKNTVRSVQRLPNPRRHTATYVARLYQRWLPVFFRALIGVKSRGENSTFQVVGVPLLKLTFIPSRSDDHRQLFYIVGGLLAGRKDKGWLEFRSVLDDRYIISAIHEFVPALPWYLYVLTQAPAHKWVMNRFGRYLSHADH